MSGNAPVHLTTGETARLCSVKPDTVLKWIKKGRLPAITTAGGHHRILYRDVVQLIEGREPSTSGREAVRPMRCWEYKSGGGAVLETCSACAYYQRAKADRLRIVVASQDLAFMAGLAAEDNGRLSFKFVANAYEAAAAIYVLHPPFVLVDQALKDYRDLIESIARDTCVPGLKIVLATGPAGPLPPVEAAACQIARQIAKPFGRSRIQEVLDSFPVEPA